jgi:hypothetical protein
MNARAVGSLAVIVLMAAALLTGCSLPDSGESSGSPESTSGSPESTSGSPAVTSGPPELTPDTMTPEPFEYVMGTAVVPVKESPMPGKGIRYQDPAFKTMVIRLTDIDEDGYQGPGIQNEYSRSDPENCDGTIIVMRSNTAAWYLYRPDTGEVLASLDDVFHDCTAEPEPRWDHKDPNVFYFVCGPELRRYDIASKESTTLHDFSKEVPGTMAVHTGSEGDASMDRRQWFFMAVDDDWKMLALISYDLEKDKVIALKKGGFPDKVNGVSSDMSGRHALVGYDELLEADVFSVDLKTSRRLSDGSNGHCDLALLPDGRDVLVYQNIRNDYICMSDLETGEETQILRIPFEVNWDIGLHISGNSYKTPGWVLVSTYGAREAPEEDTHSWMDTQLFMLELVPSPRVWRLAHTHCYTSEEATGEKVYYAEAFATITASGRRVYFGSNWGKIKEDYSEAYEIPLPAGWYSGVPK